MNKQNDDGDRSTSSRYSRDATFQHLPSDKNPRHVSTAAGTVPRGEDAYFVCPMGTAPGQ